MNTADSVGELMLDEARADLSHADNKAGLLLAAYGVAIAALLAGFVAGDFTPTKLTALPRFLWWIGSAALTLAIALAGAAVYPRLKRDKRPEGAYFWGDVALLDSPDETAEVLSRMTPDSASSRTADQLWFVSRSVRNKYRLIQVSILSGGSAAVLFVLCGLANL